MTDEQAMQAAIKLAHESREKYKHAVGAVLVKNGQIVVTGLSYGNNFHAELNCIQAALKTFGPDNPNGRNLEGCTLYSTQESCTMCHAMALYANIDRLVFGSYAKDLTETNTYEYPDFDLAKLTEGCTKFDGGRMELVGGVLRDECKALMIDHVYWTSP